MTTIYDIAKRAGVSATTVSKVLNGYPDVSLKTREKVQRITAELGYQPSAVARSLVTRRSMTVGVFFQDHVNSGFRHPFLHDVIASFKDVVGAAGYDLLFFSDVRDQHAAQGFAARAKHRDVDGLFLLGVPRTDPGLAALSRSQIPVVSVDLDLFGSRASYLSSDNVGGARKAVQHLVERGHRRIAFIGDRFGTKPGHDRMLGYQQSLQEWSLQYRSEWVLEGDFTEPSGYLAMKQLLGLDELPTAVFCASDMMAIGAMKAISEVGWCVGEEISLVGFDDIDLSRYVTPRLTTIRQNTEQMGEMAAKELLELMNTANKPPGVITVETDLIVRDSVRDLNG
ncbi:LacI family DNA-binding transcriptional regulator [Alicyclobacillus fastidiosus]|uniref:LacI family DNA-binding transcriptional regulator n=1 Tax=Alicyclobacillus fastidiosus TaxID=392011 RepID=A0ABV5AMR3_9BACL|nr:LacI family DNA-binding transcriptional regulator [Alicyclobacillus fastidiosus]WEH10207.1 LacI family DNA-binding transcriptional regulator [Alicyclobacillus fastidiosus]